MIDTPTSRAAASLAVAAFLTWCPNADFGAGSTPVSVTPVSVTSSTVTSSTVIPAPSCQDGSPPARVVVVAASDVQASSSATLDPPRC